MRKLVSDLIRDGYLRTEIIQNAFFKINRGDFVPLEFERVANKNISLPTGFGQQIIQPQKAAFVLENLNLTKGQKILCLGSGFGWVPNILAEIVGEEGKVVVVDEILKLNEISKENSKGYDFLKKGLIEFIVDEEKNGHLVKAPYDRIVSLVSLDEIPERLKKQLKIGGKMLIPIRGHYNLVERKTAQHFFEEEDLYLKELKIQAAQKLYSNNL